MIYTVTANPNIDYYMNPQGAPALGAINRSAGESCHPGGKGINVSIVLSRLGMTTLALAFAAGQVGKLLEGLLEEAGCPHQLFWLREGQTRINLKLTGPQETAFNGKGPEVDGAAARALLERLCRLGPKDTLVLSGNLPGSLRAKYDEMLAIPAQTGARLVVDAEGASLAAALPHEPFLVKPNREELAALLHSPMETDEAVRSGAQRLQALGARNVLVSLGGDGALFLGEEGRCLRGKIDNINNIMSTVGAGDSMVAGFLYGFSLDGTYETAFRWGLAAGTATASSPVLADKSTVVDRLSHVQLTSVL